MKKRGKVIFFVTSLQSGGVENYLLRFIDDKYNEFDSITVFCKAGYAGQLEPQFKSYRNVKIVKRKIGYLNPFDYLYVYRFFTKNRYDAVCDFNGNFAGLILLIAKLGSVATRVAFYRNSSDRFKRSTIKNLYNRCLKSLVLSCSTNILANSKAAFNYYFSRRWLEDKRFVVVYNGINSNQFILEKENLRNEFGIPENAFVVGHTGRYNSAKNHTTFLKVAEDLLKENEDFYFILCGNGVRNNLQSYVLERKLEKRILLFENRNDIPRFLNTMDCYYFPSITEGQPNALIEAMLMGLPIVASDIEPIKETVPEQLLPHLLPSSDVAGAKNTIMKIYRKELLFNFKEWTIEHYSSKKLFDQFFYYL